MPSKKRREYWRAWAVLPANTFSTGPTSGKFASGANGNVLPVINMQPVQGFSAVLRGPVKGTYLVTSDNGFGTKANSADGLLRVDAVKPNFETGEVTPANRFTCEELTVFTSASYLTLSDPWKNIP